MADSDFARMAATAAAAARSWAEAFPAGDLRERALQEVAGVMAYRGGEPR